MSTNRCFVWVHGGLEDMDVIITSDEFPTRTLNRPKEEPMHKGLRRLAMTLKRKSEKSKKKKGNRVADREPAEADDDDVVVKLLDSHGQPVSPELPNTAAWTNGNLLAIGTQMFPVVVNAPRVRLELQMGAVRVGCAIAPYVASMHHLHSLDTCIWTWKRIPMETSLVYHQTLGYTFDVSPDQMTEVSSHRCYIPTAEDVGHRLCIACQPTLHDGEATVFGPLYQCVTSEPVSPFPTADHLLAPLFARHSATPHFISSPEFRVLSYNLLADCYANNVSTQTTTFSHCPLPYLDSIYRRQLAMKEISGYHADLMCFQEMGRTAYQQHFEPLLQDIGYRGVLDEKAGDLCEGLATFWRTERFLQVAHRRFILRELVRDSVAFAHIADNCPALWEVLTHVNTVAQVNVLRDIHSDGTLLALVNTHLFFRPTAPHIRALQVALILQGVRTILQGMGRAAIVLCGDFNATPDDEPYAFFCNGTSPSTAHMWLLGRSLKWSKGEDCNDLNRDADPEDEGTSPVTIDGTHFACELNHPYPGLRSAYYEVEGKEPLYTNLIPAFSGTLDYIFFHPSYLSALRVVPIPDKEVAMQHQGLPSMVFPSDHMALVADLQWANTKDYT